MKYFFGFIAIVLLVIGVIILVLRGFSGKPEQTKAQLISYANTSAVMSLTVDGPINADQLHRGYTVSVSRSESRIETYKGYQGEIIESKSYQSNQTAYANFLRALDLAGFDETNGSKINDERGTCASGRRFILTIENGSREIQRYWTTSCKGGNSKAQLSRVQSLFQAQIPDYASIITNLNKK